MRSQALALFLSVALASLTARPCFGVTQTQVFTYQGRLNQNGSPLNGTANLVFKMFDAASLGTQKGPTVTANSHPVNNGLFTIALEFTGFGTFDGHPRWLEITVNGTTLTPRQALTAAPFAITLAPGAVIDGEANFSQTLTAKNNLNFAGAAGVYGQHGLSSGNFGVGVAGVWGDSQTHEGVIATSDSGIGLAAYSNSSIGVYGESDGNGASGIDAGVRGFATSPTGVNYGVYGQTNSSLGYAGYFGGRGFFSNEVGIGILNPEAPLHVVDGADTSVGGGGYIILGSTAGTNISIDNNEIMARVAGAAGTLSINNEGGNVNILANGGGNVGIGVTGPAFLLHVDGAAAKPGGGTWSNTSDRRLKKNIAPLTGSLDQLLDLHGVTFEYIDPKSIHELEGTRIGMIAQEVEQVFPDWVQQRADGYKAVTYRGFEALTVEALRDLRSEKDAQLAQRDARIAALEQDNQQLLDRLAVLEAAVAQLGHQKVSR